MRRSFVCVAATFIAAFAAGSAATARAQSPRAGTVIVPASNSVPPQDRGKRAHTNFLIFLPSKAASHAKGATPAFTISSPEGETPSSLACVYKVGSQNLSLTLSKNCPLINGVYPSSTPMNYDNPSGGSNIIAIVDAYDYPTATNDFDVFSNEFGLPSGDKCGASGNLPCFTKIWLGGSTVTSNGGWAQEEALDIEWSHAMAPHAQIVLVEAASNSFTSLMQAVNYASNYVTSNATNGVGEVSMSWGGGESSSELSNDSYFKDAGITYFASSGDTGGQVIWPSTSPDVVSAGGTSVTRDSNHYFTGETAWSGSGGGPSSYETMPSYQDVTKNVNKTKDRGTPDISFDADPNTGVSVYDSTPSQGLSGWLIFGGTSVASPSLAGIANNAGAFDGGWDGGNNPSSVQNNLYSNYASETSSGTSCNYNSNSATPFYDIISGSAGNYNAGPCWDFTNGIGTLRGLAGPTGSTSPALSLSASSTTLTVTQGSSNATSTITVTPGSYTGTIYLTATPSNSNLSVSISPSSGSGSSSWTSQLNVGAGTATYGTYTVTVDGAESSTGSPVSSMSVTVTVNAPPPAPTNLIATAGSGQVSLSWTASSGANSYEVFSANKQGGENLTGTPLATTSSTSYTDTGLTGGQPYYYEVEAVGTYGTSAASNEASATPSTPPPFSLSASSTTITVTQGSPSVTSTITVTPGSYTGTVSLTATQTTGSALSVGISPASGSGGSSWTSTLSVGAGTATFGTYTVTVTGTETGGSFSSSTSVSVTVNAPPAAPTNLIPTAGSGQVSLTWMASSGANSYDVLRGTSSGGETLLTSGVTSTSYTDTSVTGGQTYYYEVEAVGTYGTSAASKEVSATPTASTAGFSIGATDFSVPIGSSGSTNVTVSPSGGFTGSVTIAVTWSPAQPKFSNGSFGTNPVTISGTTQGSSTFTVRTNSKVQPGTYTLTFTGTSGSLSKSTSVTMTIGSGGGPPPAPANLTATAGNGVVTLSWTASSGVSDYNVLKGTSASSLSLITGVTSTSYTDNNVTNGQTYYYEVEAVSGTGTSSPSNEVSATPTASSGGSPDFSISAGNISVTRGSSTITTVTVKPSGTFTGSINVTLSVTGLPSNVSGSFSPNTVTISSSTSGTSKLTLTASPHGPAKTYTITITGTSGSLSHSYPVTLTVN